LVNLKFILEDADVNRTFVTSLKLILISQLSKVKYTVMILYSVFSSYKLWKWSILCRQLLWQDVLPVSGWGAPSKEMSTWY